MTPTPDPETALIRSLNPFHTNAPPLPRTRLLGGEYVFDAETAASIDAAEEMAGILEVYLYWREALAWRLSRSGNLN